MFPAHIRTEDSCSCLVMCFILMNCTVKCWLLIGRQPVTWRQYWSLIGQWDAEMFESVLAYCNPSQAWCSVYRLQGGQIIMLSSVFYIEQTLWYLLCVSEHTWESEMNVSRRDSYIVESCLVLDHWTSSSSSVNLQSRCQDVHDSHAGWWQRTSWRPQVGPSSIFRVKSFRNIWNKSKIKLFKWIWFSHHSI